MAGVLRYTCALYDIHPSWNNGQKMIYTGCIPCCTGYSFQKERNAEERHHPMSLDMILYNMASLTHGGHKIKSEPGS